jgi:hypothetical protein
VALVVCCEVRRSFGTKAARSASAHIPLEANASAEQ